MPLGRLAEIWNSFAGAPGFDKLKPVKKFENRAKAVARIWDAIPSLAAGVTGAPVGLTAKPTTTKAKKARKAKTPPKAAKQAEARPGSKTATVVAMLQRKNGATLVEIMEKMGWQKHTVRGFMAGAMKKAGFSVESFKSDKGDRTYRINQ